MYDYHRDLHTTVRHVYGYRAECTCGWRGPIRSFVLEVRTDVREHAGGHRPVSA